MRFRRLAPLLLLLLPLAAPLPAVAATTPAPAAAESAAQVAAGLLSHRALYALTLDHARGDVVAATGTMAFEITDACEGWATRQRLRMTVTNRDGQPLEMVSDYATYESKAGTELDFRMRQTTEGATTQQVQGAASLSKPGGEGEVRYVLPKPVTMKLPSGTLFPMWHTATLIAAAEAGGRFLSLPLFDGTGADGVQDSTIAITGWNKPAPAPFPQLAGQPSGLFHVAFYPHGGDAALPEYEVGMRYWRDGVADTLRMDFGDFVLSGKLTEFAPQPPAKC